MKKHTTTESTILEVSPFVHSPTPRYVGPVLLAMDKKHKPSMHDVVADGEGTFRHRIVWPDHSGVYLQHTRKTLSAMTLHLLHDAAYEAAQEVEQMFHGREHH